jgi:COMPASS component SPP1
MQDQKVNGDQIEQCVKDARQPEAYIQNHTEHALGKQIGHASSAKCRHDAQTREEQQMLLGRYESFVQRLRLAEHKQGRLEAAIRAAEDLPDLETLPEDTAEVPKKKGKKPSKAKAGPSSDDRRPCGFDESLLTDALATEGREVPDMANPDTQSQSICMQPKRKCTRHIGWQKVRSVALEMEQTSLVCSHTTP